MTPPWSIFRREGVERIEIAGSSLPGGSRSGRFKPDERRPRIRACHVLAASAVLSILTALLLIGQIGQVALAPGGVLSAVALGCVIATVAQAVAAWIWWDAW